MTKSIEEQANEYATGDGGTIEKRKCFTVDLHLGNPQQYEYVKIYNNDAYCGFIAGAKSRDVQWSAVVNELREALKHTNEFCLCKRNTYGFDYHEDHPVMGKPKSGSRWLTPRDYNKDAITKADQLLKEMGIK